MIGDPPESEPVILHINVFESEKQKSKPSVDLRMHWVCPAWPVVDVEREAPVLWAGTLVVGALRARRHSPYESALALLDAAACVRQRWPHLPKGHYQCGNRNQN